jgi:leucyl aminopeptidase (aminopeptidase T)
MAADSDSEPLDEAEQAEEMLGVARSVVSTCLAVRREDTVLVITDPMTSTIARALYEAAARITERLILVMIPPSLKRGAEIPSVVADLMRNADVIIIATRNSFTHTRARANASKEGARIASMPGIDAEVMAHGMTEDYTALRREIRGMNSVFRRRRNVHVTTPAGTDVRFTTGSRWILDDNGLIVRPGAVGNLPAGKIFVLPQEGTASGTIAIDSTWEGRILEEPLRFDVEDGLVTSIEGGELADEIDSILELAKSGLRRSRERAYTLAEFGFGMNSRARLLGNRLEDQVVRGTAYFSFGDNTALGGSAKVGVKMSGVMSKPSCTLDDITLISEGKVTAS